MDKKNIKYFHHLSKEQKVLEIKNQNQKKKTQEKVKNRKNQTKRQ